MGGEKQILGLNRGFPLLYLCSHTLSWLTSIYYVLLFSWCNKQIWSGDILQPNGRLQVFSKLKNEIQSTQILTKRNEFKSVLEREGMLNYGMCEYGKGQMFKKKKVFNIRFSIPSQFSQKKTIHVSHTNSVYQKESKCHNTKRSYQCLCKKERWIALWLLLFFANDSGDRITLKYCLAKLQ